MEAITLQNLPSKEERARIGLLARAVYEQVRHALEKEHGASMLRSTSILTITPLRLRKKKRRDGCMRSILASCLLSFASAIVRFIILVERV